MRWLLLIVLSLATSGCCRLIDLAVDDEGGSDESVDLGDGAFPASNEAKPSDWSWKARKLDPSEYRVGYRIPRDTAEELRDEYRDWAREVQHTRVEKGFRWRPPEKRCIGGLHCIYEEIDEQQGEAVVTMARRFAARARKAKLNAVDLTRLVVTFVQNIKYRIPKEEPFGVLPPANVLKQKEGDCDSKSLLAHLILRDLGIDSVLVTSRAHRHTMLGVALPSSGTTFQFNGRRYAFVETTAKQAPIGYISPKLLRPNDWRVEAMRYRTPRMIEGGGEAPPPPTTSKKKTSSKKKRKTTKKKRKPSKKPPNITDIIGGSRIRIDR